MKLERCGARRFFQWTTIFEKPCPEFELKWNEKENALSLTAKAVPDDSGSRYHYRVVLSHYDIRNILGYLSQEVITKSHSGVSEWFNRSRDYNHSFSHSLLRLLLSSSGMVSQSSPLAQKPDAEAGSPSNLVQLRKGVTMAKTVVIDEEACSGCGSCAAIAEDCFALNEEKEKAYVTDQSACSEDEIQEAIDTCPEEAISWQE
ncbi:MAG: ferredoxin [Desulfomonilaceae bacterium]